MTEDVLIVQSDKRNKQRMRVKIRNLKKGYSPNNYFKMLNPKDYNDLAVLFEDLALVINAPIDKAYSKYRQNRGDKFLY